MKKLTCLGLILALFGYSATAAEKKKEEEKEKAPAPYDISLSGLEFRSIGPALTSGRIADFAVNPDNPSEYYVAVASGGVWKTINRGVTFDPIFDGEGSYSIGCVTMDPSNHNVIWVGTGENNNQRSVAYGDGVYKSVDGGKNWENVGLKNSEHVGMIAVDPRDSAIVYVAAYGPLWSAGGDRGLYKTSDGGKNWEAILTVSEHTGISEIHLDPRDADTMYAVAHQRRRHVFTLIDGGPESAIHKSTDGGKTWRKSARGLPEGHVGRIGLDISPANPDILYAIVEATGEKGGFYRSMDRGETWDRTSDYTSRGNYYQEIIADPVDPNRVYSMDTYGQVSEDGGKTWSNAGEKNKHVDDHALWIDPKNPDYLLNGNDGGVYESWDRGATWRFMVNLPVTQFYRVGIDNSEPFYFVYGGTQDNYTLGGPSRTTSPNGIANEDWFVTLGGDGFQPRVDPENPNIVYAQWQHGNLTRFDRQSGEELDIKPRAGKGEDAIIWNWDSPFIISPHSPTRLYFAGDRVFRSDDRGNSWRAVSDDLTRQLDRNALDVMGQTWPMDAVAKHSSTSVWGNIVALDESPVAENLLWAGTDDGLVHVSESGGENWTKLDRFPGIPAMTYVNDLLASRHARNTVYAAFNNHKRGDFKPYVMKSTDLGKSWTSISSTLPARGSVYSIVEDHEKPGLLFVGTEFGVFFTVDGGEYWKKLGSGLPTIAVRDIEIHRGENDLVLATFGRGFYILDDYSPLRELTPEFGNRDAHIFGVSDALMFNQYSRIGGDDKSFQGEAFYGARNPDMGAKIAFFFKEKVKTKKEIREEADKNKFEKKEKITYPSLEELRAEEVELPPLLLLTITDEGGSHVRTLRTDASDGIQRINWDLKFPNTTTADESRAGYKDDAESGISVVPGTYNVTLSKNINGEITQLAGPLSFDVHALNNQTLPGDRNALLAFQRKLSELAKARNAARGSVDEIEGKINHYRAALKALDQPHTALDADVRGLELALNDIKRKLFGDDTLDRLDRNQPPSISTRVNQAVFAGFGSTSDPTETQREVYTILAEEFDPVIAQLNGLMMTEVPSIERRLDEMGAPWTPGRPVEWRKD